jgi:hypothetical protein
MKLKRTGPTRQQVRYALFREAWERLKETDFEGESVRIRDYEGKPLIHRPDRAMLREMAHQRMQRDFRTLRERERAVTAQPR